MIKDTEELVKQKDAEKENLKKEIEKLEQRKAQSE